MWVRQNVLLNMLNVKVSSFVWLWLTDSSEFWSGWVLTEPIGWSDYSSNLKNLITQNVCCEMPINNARLPPPPFLLPCCKLWVVKCTEHVAYVAKIFFLFPHCTPLGVYTGECLLFSSPPLMLCCNKNYITGGIWSAGLEFDRSELYYFIFLILFPVF